MQLRRTFFSEEIQVLHCHTASGYGMDQETVESSTRLQRVSRRPMMNREANSQGADNVLVDLGFDDAPELTAKAALALKLNSLIDQHGLSHIETAALTGMTQPKVSQVRRYKLQNISLERLMQALVSLGQHVEIVVQPAKRSHSAGIRVTA